MLFAKRRLHKEGCAALPPSAEELCLFALEFRNSRTFRNYKCQLAKACRLLGRDTAVFGDTVVCQARKAIAKRHPVRRPAKPFALLSHLPAMLDFVREDRSLHALFALAWGFALRVPSEALLIERGDPRAETSFQFSDADLRNPIARVVLFVAADTATLHFSRRKNRDGPTVAWRTCWCASSPATCVVHAARPFVERVRVGEPAFPHLRRISSRGVVSPAASIARAIRAAAIHAGAPGGSSFTSKAFRRGHAETKRRCKGRLCEILRGGDWSSRAFREYLDMNRNEGEATTEAVSAAASGSAPGRSAPGGAARPTR